MSQSCFELGLGRNDYSCWLLEKGGGIIVHGVRNIWGWVWWTLPLPSQAHAYLAPSERKTGGRKRNSLTAVSWGEVQVVAQQHIPFSSTQRGVSWRRWLEGEGLQCLPAAGHLSEVLAESCCLRLALTPAIMYRGIFTLKAQSEKANLFCRV